MIYNVLKFVDFGLVCVFGIFVCAYTYEVVTLWYRASEIFFGVRYYFMLVDVWSIGCIFVEMINGKLLFLGDFEIDELFKIFKILGISNEILWFEV